MVHADCVWVGLRPTIDAEIVANERMWESAFADICYFGGRDFTEIDLVGFCRHLLLWRQRFHRDFAEIYLL